MNILIGLVFILAFSFLLSHLGRKIRVPSVVALILAGLFLNLEFFKKILIDPHSSVFSLLGNFGLLILMFLAGTETSWKMMKKEERDSLYVAILAFIIPFALGFFVLRILGFSSSVSLIVGLSMSITAEATKAKVLLDIHKLKTKIGSMLMGAGIIDDLLGLSFFLIIALFNNLQTGEAILTLGVIAAFFCGIFMQSFNQHSFFKYSKKFLFLFVPFFFVSLGMHFDFHSLVLNPLLLLLIIALAFIGKIFGAILAAPFVSFNCKKLFLVGWAMNSRGAIELALALLAFKQKIIDNEIYSSLIIMALITTLIFPFVLTKMIKKNPQIMN